MSTDQSREELPIAGFTHPSGSMLSFGVARANRLGHRAVVWLDDAQARIAELEAKLSSAREVAMEEALRVCEAEALEDPQVGTEDIAYDLAVSHCAEAIRQLAAQADKRPAAKEE
jgi:hypothetical protein